MQREDQPHTVAVPTKSCSNCSKHDYTNHYLHRAQGAVSVWPCLKFCHSIRADMCLKEGKISGEFFGLLSPTS